MVDIIAAGHICLDLLPGMSMVPLANIASPGKLFEVDALNVATGGSVSNTGLALHRLGVDVGLMGKVGDDLTGRVIIAYLTDHDEHLADFVKVLPGEASSYTVVLSPENSDRIFLHCAGANTTFGVADIDFEKVKTAKIFHLGYPQLLPRTFTDDGAELLQIFQQAKAAGVITSLDTAMPDPSKASGKANWHHILEKTLPHVDIFIPSYEELLVMLRPDDYVNWESDLFAHLSLALLDELTDELLDMGVAITGVKLADAGLYLRSTPDSDRLQIFEKLLSDVSLWQNVRLYHPAYAINLVGTTGAGDSAYGAVLAALLNGLPPEQTARVANMVGGCACEASDASGGILSWDATLKRLKNNPLSDYQIS
ncbi:MAG: carbohydrate kinase family protein [Aggregatilineales bacterium]